MIFKRTNSIKQTFIICSPYNLKFFENFIFIETVACADPETCLRVCDNAAGCSNVAYPQLILGLAPIGKRVSKTTTSIEALP